MVGKWGICAGGTSRVGLSGAALVSLALPQMMRRATAELRRVAAIVALGALAELPWGVAQCYNGSRVPGGTVIGGKIPPPCEPEPEPEPEPENITHTVSVWLVPGLMAFYSVVIALEVCGYSVLRSKHQEAFEEAKKNGDIADHGTTVFNMRATSDSKQRGLKSGDSAKSSGISVEEEEEEEHEASHPSEEARGAEQGEPEPDTLVDRMCEFIFITIGDVENTKKMGLDAAMYLAHLQLCSAFWTVQSLTTGIAMVGCYQIYGVQTGLDMYTWSYANLREEHRWISVAAALWMVVTTVVFAAYRAKVMDRLKLRVGYGDLRSTTTLWFDSVPNHLTETQINDWFVSRYPDSVESTRLALDVHELGTNIRTRRRIILKINATVEKLERKQAALILAGNALIPISRGRPSGPEKAPDAKPEVPPGLTKEVKKIEKCLQHLQVLNAEEPQLRAKRFVGSGNAFITFSSEQHALSFRMEHSAGKITDAELHIEKWRAMFAPLPAEIYWENMGLGPVMRLLNTIVGLALTTLMFSFFCAIVAAAVFFIGWDYMKVLYGLEAHENIKVMVEDIKDAMSWPIYYGILALGLFVSILGLEEHMAPIIKFFSKFERPVTKSKKQSSYLAKAYWFYVLFHLVLSTIGFYVLVQYVSTPDWQKLYLLCVGTFHVNRVLLTCAVVDPFHMLEGVKYFRRPNIELGAAEQLKLNSAEDEEDLDVIAEEKDEYFNDRYDFSKNYGESIAIFTAISYYSLMHPCIMPVGAVYYYTKYLIDKYEVTQQFSKSRIQYGRRARSTTRLILTSMVVGTIGNIVHYGWIQPDAAMFDLHCVVFVFALLIWLAYCYGKQYAPAFLQPKGKRKRLKQLQTSDWETNDDDSVPTSTKLCYLPPTPESMDLGTLDQRPLLFCQSLDSNALPCACRC